jgi:hypothetical protein
MGTLLAVPGYQSPVPEAFQFIQDSEFQRGVLLMASEFVFVVLWLPLLLLFIASASCIKI